jgi:hypothetical protein
MMPTRCFFLSDNNSSAVRSEGSMIQIMPALGPYFFVATALCALSNYLDAAESQPTLGAVCTLLYNAPKVLRRIFEVSHAKAKSG